MKAILPYLKSFNKDSQKMIIFVKSKRSADELAARINTKLNCAEALHGDRNQHEREATLKAFRNGNTRILVATDLAARGIDVDDVTIVINFDFPGNIEEYVHRVGRTGRAGKSGTAVSFFTKENCSSAEELIKILKNSKKVAEIPSELDEMVSFAKQKSAYSRDFVSTRYREGGIQDQRNNRRNFNNRY